MPNGIREPLSRDFNFAFAYGNRGKTMHFMDAGRLYMKQLMSGNEAIARGAYEAGIQLCSAYPGTPSTEILENMVLYKDDIYSEWTPNEKVAAEVAYGAAVAGARALCAMKMVGLNVAADPLFTAGYMGVKGAYVIVTADDPGMHSSQNEQDNRYYAKAAKVALIEPSDSQECKDFVKYACEISEKYDMPVLFRTTTRINHSKSLMEFGRRQEHEITEYKKDIMKYVCAPANAYRNHPKVEGNLKSLEAYANNCELNKVEMNGFKIGVISAGVAYKYAKEAFPSDTSFLKLGLTWPMPMNLIRDFASKVEKLYVIEELEPFMETEIKAAGIQCTGKELTGKMYELNPQLIAERVLGQKPATKEVDVKAVARPPALCPGCPHRGFFYTLAKDKNNVVTGDIGCYTLGMAPPLSCMDTCICMGGGLTVGMGMSKVFERTGDKDKRIFAVVGDSTFFHSGMTGAAEIIYNGGNVIPVILDNRITGMTGHQDNPGSGYALMGEEVPVLSVEKIMEAYGYKVFAVDPQDLTAMQKAVNDALAYDRHACIVTKRPCVLIKRNPKSKDKCAVDKEKCKSCKMCLKVGCPAISFEEGKSVIDRDQCVGCTVCAQVCPFDAIEKEEF